MADCYYHGYSGGPGECSYCREERRNNLDRGELPGYRDPETGKPDFTANDANLSSLGRENYAKMKQQPMASGSEDTGTRS